MEMIETNDEKKSKADIIFESIKSNSITLNKIDLSNCNLLEFPSELLLVSSIVTMLNFGGNKISKLPDEIIHFQQLRILFFANNEFKTFPEILSQLKSLYMVNLNYFLIIFNIIIILIIILFLLLLLLLDIF